MTFEALRAFVVSAMMVIGRPEHIPIDNPANDAFTAATATALLADGDEHLTGSLRGDAVLVVWEAYDESRWGWRWAGTTFAHDACPAGDQGRAHGYWQMQVRAELACDTDKAAAYWLAWAHASQRRCARLPLDERLAELHSGTCALGHVLSRQRFRRAAAILAVIDDES